MERCGEEEVEIDRERGRGGVKGHGDTQMDIYNDELTQLMIDGLKTRINP